LDENGKAIIKKLREWAGDLFNTVDPPVAEIHTIIPPSYICKSIPLLVSTSTEYNTWRK
jgi:hypothetical protein